MEPILNKFSIAGELTGNAADFTSKSFLVSPFVPVKYSIPVLPCTTSLFGDAWVAPNWRHLLWSRGVHFKPGHSFMILRCFILCLILNPHRASLFLVHHWPSIPQLPTVVCDICGPITLKQTWEILLMFQISLVYLLVMGYEKKSCIHKLVDFTDKRL